MRQYKDVLHDAVAQHDEQAHEDHGRDPRVMSEDADDLRDVPGDEARPPHSELGLDPHGRPCNQPRGARAKYQGGGPAPPIRS